MIFKIGSKISNLFSSNKEKLDETKLQELEEIFVLSDISVNIFDAILESIKKKYFDKSATISDIKQVVKDEIKNHIKCDFSTNNLLEKIDNSPTPFVILFTGVNGGGKTTSIGKLSSILKAHNKKVLVCAGDTFRVVATEQLKSWCDKIGVDLISSEKKDPSALAFDAYKKAVNENYDVLLIDTAGRLQSRDDLMAELQKITRVLKKQNENIPNESILVLDSSIGQNMLSQAETFIKYSNTTGFIITKMDGTSKAGALISLMNTYKLPVYFIGVGEKEADLIKFDIDYYLNKILELE